MGGLTMNIIQTFRHIFPTQHTQCVAVMNTLKRQLKDQWVGWLLGRLVGLLVVRSVGQALQVVVP